jgi:ceramide synthetase
MENIFKNYPDDHINEQVFGLREYYLFCCGFYMQALVSLVFIDERMKDFYEMFIHHVVTISLIFISISTVHHRFGSMVILLHDAVDVFLYVAKSFHEAHYTTVSSVLFGLFALIFLVLRLMYFPYLVHYAYANPFYQYWPNTWYVIRDVPNTSSFFDLSSYGMCINGKCLSTYWFLFSLCCVLIVLHIYWFYLIVQVIIKGLMGDFHDVREINDDKKSNTVKKVEPPQGKDTSEHQKDD